MNYAVVGSGNAAWVVAQAWSERENACHGVLSRDAKSGQALATALHTQNVSLWPSSTLFDGVVLLAVSDDALPAVAQEARRAFPNALLLHLSGATNRNILPGRSAVVWPMASLQRGGRLNHSKTRVYWEVSDESDRAEVEKLAHAMSNHCHELPSDARLALHTAATLSNNFVTHLLVESRRLCNDFNVDPRALHDLWEQTVQMQINHPTGDWQTGPARRRDEQTLSAHLRVLNDRPELALAYQALTASIQAAYPTTSADPSVTKEALNQAPKSL
jgi:predicted short-subunit dehydrogenase-like oxidoreductase (DUF2520 family)